MENPAQSQNIILTVKYVKTEKKQHQAHCMTVVLTEQRFNQHGVTLSAMKLQQKVPIK